MHSEMSESRFRSRISQERRAEGWKREKLKQKTTVKSVVVKIDLGEERKRRERNSRETADRRGERITNGQGSTRSRS
jgi:ribosome-binding protein aMBF1 (putative translation factor)